MGKKTLVKILFILIGLATVLVAIRVLEEEDVIKDRIRKTDQTTLLVK